MIFAQVSPAGAQVSRPRILPHSISHPRPRGSPNLSFMAISSLPKYTGNASGTQLKTSKSMDLKPEDFIKMMVTQLQNQDPTQPAKNEELLAQMSQIGQLQSSNALTDSLKGMVLQNQIGSAGNMIGKTVQGTDDTDADVKGIVNSVKVNGDGVYLELDSGRTLAMSKVTSIAQGAAATAVAPASANTAAH
jgi:flagellar basal-body rod modification protein FlgD